MVDSAHFQPDDRPVDDQLADLRVRIDAVDQQLIALINQRARLAQAVGEVKKLDGSPVFRPDREAQVIDRVKAQNPGPVREDSLAPIWREIMSACRALEAQQRVAFLGPIGTFSEQATLNYFGSSIDALACPSVDEVFRATISGSADYGVVPVENSTEGVVARSLDLLLASPLTIVGETSLLVTHNLLRKATSREGIAVVCAHPQALAQCHNWLSQNLPDAERRPVSSNAEGARLASIEPSTAAIASDVAAARYGLQIVTPNIQDDPHNRTRFAVIGRYVCAASGLDQTSLILSVPDRAGAVHALIELLARHGVSMKRFESRSARQGDWEYYFYIDLIGHQDDAPVAAALSELRANAAFCKVIGSYPRAA